MITHKHHIVPKHNGGTDDTSNIVELTIEEHAEAHRKLYEEDGRWQDRLAWQALSGQIGKEEIIRQKIVLANKGVKRTTEHKRNISLAKMGHKHSEKTKRRMSEAQSGVPKSKEHKAALRKPKNLSEEARSVLSERAKKQKSNLGKTWSEDTKKKMSEGAKKRKRVTCPHCNIKMDASNASRYHFEKCKSKK